jgi:hypothetical protein
MTTFEISCTSRRSRCQDHLFSYKKAKLFPEWNIKLVQEAVNTFNKAKMIRVKKCHAKKLASRVADPDAHGSALI